MIWTRRLFWVAGIFGVLVLAPQYFMEGRIGTSYPPAITHAEYFYGFVGVGLAWQIAFLIIGTDPVRFRPLIIPSALEKFSFSAAAVWLFASGRARQHSAFSPRSISCSACCSSSPSCDWVMQKEMPHSAARQFRSAVHGTSSRYDIRPRIHAGLPG